MPAIEAAVAARVIAQPILDLYEKGKDRFESQLQKWKNVAARRALAQKVAACQKVKTFWQRDKDVTISSFYYPSRISFDGDVVKKIDSLKDLPSFGNFVIQGTVGQGKSIFLRYLCVQELREAGTNRIPVLIELRTITSKGIRFAIYEALDRLGFAVDDQLFDFYAQSKNLVLMLDGFDELDEALIRNVISELDGLSEKYPNLQIFVTSRPQNSIQDSRNFRVIQLAPLQPDDHEPFIKRIGVKGADVARLLNAIKTSSAEVSSLLKTPLMLTLFVIVYRAEQAIPNELPDFFESLFQTLFTKHDKSKPGFTRTQKSGLGERTLQQLFQAFCFSVIQLRHQTTLSNESFHGALDQAKKYTDIRCDSDSFKHDITKITCLMQEEGFYLQFIHKSVLEFYAASFVRGLTEEVANRFYSKQVTDRSLQFRWRQVLQFLSQIDRYRFIRYYAIPVITSELIGLGIEPPFEPNKLPDNLAERLFSGVTFGFGHNDELGKWTQRYIGPFAARSQYTDCTHLLISQTVFPDVIVVTFNSAEEVRQRFPTATNDTEHGVGTGELAIPWHDVMSKKQVSDVENRSKDFVRSLIEKLQEFENYVKLENQKVDLLEI